MEAEVSVSDEQVDRFQKEGVIVLRGLLGGWVEVLRRGVAKNMKSPSADVRIYRNDDGSGLFFGDYCNWDRIPEYRAFVFDSPAARIAARLTRSKEIRLFHEHVLVKEPGTEVATPWHQDQPYYCVDGEQTCSLWTTLDPVSREVCPEFVAGSHRWGKFYRPERFNRQPLNETDGLEAVPDISGHREDYDIKSWAMEPGDTIAFSFRTVHGAPPNLSSRTRRRAFSSRWTGDDCRFADRKGVTSPPFRGIGLHHGDRLEADEFPLVIGTSRRLTSRA